MPPKYSAAQRAAFGKRMAAARAVKTLSGRGAYKTKKSSASTADVKKQVKAVKKEVSAMKGLLTGGGAALGGMFGPLGSQVGSGLGSLASKILGFGDYSLTRNSLIESETGDQVPFIHSAKDGVRIRHREFIQDIAGSVNFQNNTFEVNPGLSATFPWLSAIAQNFEEYRMEGLVFEYRTTSVDALNSANTALGTVVLAAEYNSAAAPYVNKQQMQNSMWSTSTKPSCSMIMPVECSPAMNPLANQYIRLGAVPTGQDIRMYDLCNVQIATVGSQSGITTIGELWCSYDVVLLKPQLSSGLNLEGESANYTLNSPAITDSYFGATSTVVFDSMGVVVKPTSFEFPLGSQGNYLVNYHVTGSSAVLVAPTAAISGGDLLLDRYDNGGTSVIHNGGSTAAIFIYEFIVAIPDPNIQCITTFSLGTLPTSAAYGNLVITQLAGDY